MQDFKDRTIVITGAANGLGKALAIEFYKLGSHLALCDIDKTGLELLKTENDLIKLPFRKVYNFRPGIITPTNGLKNMLSLYKYFGWLAPVFRLLAPNSISTLKQIGLAMINAAIKGYKEQILEVKDIKLLANFKMTIDH